MATDQEHITTTPAQTDDPYEPEHDPSPAEPEGEQFGDTGTLSEKVAEANRLTREYGRLR